MTPLRRGRDIVDRCQPVGDECLESCVTVVDILQDNSRVSPKRHFMYRQSEFFLDLLVKLYSDCGSR